MKGIVLTLFFLVVVSNSYAQTEKIDVMRKKTDHFILNGLSDSAYMYLNDFLARTDITQQERLYARMDFGKVLVEFNLITEGIAEFRKCYSIPVTPSEKKELTASLHELIGSAYFTLQNYDSALYYVKKAKSDLSKSSYIALSENAQIEGYWHYLKGNFQRTIMYYREAQAILPDGIQFLPYKLNVYSKQVLLFGELRYKDSVDVISERALKLLHQNPNKNSEFLLYSSLYLAYKKMIRTDKALMYLEKRDSVKTNMNMESHRSTITMLEKQYQTQIKEQENNALKVLNKQKEQTLSKQRIALISSVVAIALFIFVSYIFYKSSSQQKKANDLLQQQKQVIEQNNKELERLNLLNGKIFAVLSHDFKGPIAVLSLMLNQSDIKESTNPVLTSYIDDISNQLQQSMMMLDNLLDWSRLELSENKLKKESHVAEITVSVLNQLGQHIKNKHIKIDSKLKELQILPIPPEILMIVLRNLIINAIKYSEENGRVVIIGTEDSISVIDHGKGIDEKKLKKLFIQKVIPEPGTKSESGFGIGLYLCHELLEKHGAYLTAHNNSVGGATFTMHIKNY